MLGSGTSGQEALGYFLTSTRFPFRDGAERRILLSVMSTDQGYGGQRQSPQTRIGIGQTLWWTTLAGPGVHLQGRSLGSRPANHEGTDDPEEDIGLRSETIVAHDLAGGPTRQPSGKGTKRNGTFPARITNTSSKKVSLLGVWYVSGTRLKVDAA